MFRFLVSFAALTLPSVVVAQGDIDLRILRRQELPAFQGVTTDYAFGDVDRDGRLDVHISRRPDVFLVACPAGGFMRLTSNPDMARPSDDAELVDLDGDGDLDLVAVSAEEIGENPCRVLLNDGTGGFRFAPRLPLLAGAHVVAVGDVDRRNGPDLLLGRAADAGQTLLLNDGAGWFHELPGALPPIPAGIEDALMVDVDGDGYLDIALAQVEHASSLLLNDGTGKYRVQPASCFSADVLPAADVAAGDLDGDGDPDLVYAGCERGTLPCRSRVMRNLGGGCFRQELLSVVAEDARAVCAGDLDGDGDLDLAFACAGPSSTPASPVVLVNDGSGRFVRSPWTGRAVVGTAVAAIDADDDGDLDLWVGSPDRDHWYANHELQLESPWNPEIGLPYRLVLTARAGRTVPTSAVILLGSQYLQPALATPFGNLRVAIEGSVPLTVPATGEVVLEAPWGVPGRLLFQALILPSHRLESARLTNLVADAL